MFTRESLLPVDRVGELKKREPGWAPVCETNGSCSVHGDSIDLGRVFSDVAGSAPLSMGLGGGAVLGLQGPLFWSGLDGSLHTGFDNTFFPPPPPFIFLLESIILGKTLRRFILIALGDLIDSLISDTKRQIFPNGRNQAKVFCERWQAANILVDSPALQDFGFYAYTPAPLMQKNVFARNMPTEYWASNLSS